LIAESVDVGHHIVAEPALVASGNLEIRIIQVRAHLHDRLLGNLEPQLALGFCQREPEPAPEADAMAFTPEYLHGGRRVPRPKRRAPAVIAHRNIRSVKVT
jgi:hypothetical protein